MMTLWCVFRSPLMIGAELTMMDDWTKSLLTNGEVLSVLKYGHGAEQLRRDDETCVWRSFSSSDGGLVYLALFNISEKEQTVSVPLREVFAGERFNGRKCVVHDLWRKDYVEDGSDGIDAVSAKLSAHASVLYSVSLV